MKNQSILWNPRKNQSILWNPMKNQSILWNPMKNQSILWNPMKSRELPVLAHLNHLKFPMVFPSPGCPHHQRHGAHLLPRSVLHRGADRILQQLREDVKHVARDKGEGLLPLIRNTIHKSNQKTRIIICMYIYIYNYIIHIIVTNLFIGGFRIVLVRMASCSCSV